MCRYLPYHGHYSKATALRNVSRFERAVRNHAFRGTLLGHDDREAEEELERVDLEYERAKAALIRNIKLGVA